MKKHLVVTATVFLISFCVQLAACSENLPMTSKDNDATEPVSTGSIINLKPSEIDDLKNRFYQGDVGAAYQLYRYFAFSTNDEAAADSWLLQAAEAGDVEAIYALAVSLASREDYVQAQVWAKKAQSKGHERAAELLVEIEEALAARR